MKEERSLLSSRKQRTKGSPVKSTVQLHIGLWLTTWHLAFTPQVPGHGSWHFWLIHALSWAQSELTAHSARHDGGEPKYPNWHEHTACPFITLQLLLGPQGDGSHGFLGSSAITRNKRRIKSEMK